MSERLHEKIAELQDQLRQGTISRRDFLRYATLLGLTLGAAEALAACAPKPTPTTAPTAKPPTAVPPPPTTAPVAAETTAPTAPPPTAVPAPSPAAPAAQQGWGIWKYPYPVASGAFIISDEMLCQGCGICQMACSMFHYGVINKDVARIQIREYLTPLPKAVQITCIQCQDEERECTKACPVTPPAIDFDKKLMHMVVDAQRCLGVKCAQCADVCTTQAIRFYPGIQEALVCDLCEKNGVRAPNCVDVCPTGAIMYTTMEARHLWKKTAQQKITQISRRMHPLKPTQMASPGWRKV